MFAVKPGWDDQGHTQNPFFPSPIALIPTPVAILSRWAEYFVYIFLQKKTFQNLLRHVSGRYNCTGNTRRKYSFLSFNCMSSMKSFSCASHLLGVTFCTFLSFCHSNLLPWISADYGPETVKEINFSSYAGRWYQTHASLLPNITFERNGYCITADYQVLTESSLGIVNAQVEGSPIG